MPPRPPPPPSSGAGALCAYPAARPCCSMVPLPLGGAPRLRRARPGVSGRAGRSARACTRVRARAAAVAPGVRLESPEGAVYVVKDELGAGGQADTFVAVTEGGEEVVLKALSLRRSAQWKAVELFEREARTLAALDHPAIPKYVDFFESDTDNDRGFFIVQSRAPGQTLQALVASGWRPDDDELVGIARQLLGVCAYLSGLRPPVVHRDIKPSNVLYDVETRQLSLVDFGAVAAAAASATSGSTMGGLGSTVVGTFGYMAPEQFQGGGSTSTDLYSVGATLLFVLTGRSPDEWPKTRLRIDLKGVAMGSALARAVPALLEPFPEDRVRSATEALALLDGTAAQFTGNGASEEDGAADRPGVIGGRQFARSSASSGAYAMGAPTSPATSVAPASPPRRRRRPSGARTTIERSDAQLVVRIPAGGLTASSGGNVAFSVAWNSFIAFWTVGAFTGGGPLFAAFSLPFWLAGAQMGGKAVRSIAMKTEMELRPNRFSLARNLGGREIGMLEGATADLAPLRLETADIVNGQPSYYLRVKCGVDEQPLGEGLDESELAWIAAEVNAFLDETVSV